MRAVHVEETGPGHQFAQLYGRVAWDAGLLVGRASGASKRHHVVHAARTPPPEGANWSSSVTASLSSVRRDVDGLRESWFSVHAEQVRRSLPGGLDVVGVYIFCPSAVDAMPKLRALALACGEKGALELEAKEYLTVQICADSKKVVCRAFDVSDPATSAKQATWTESRFVSKWRNLTTTVALTAHLAVAPTASAPLTAAVLESLRPLLSSLNNSVILFDGRVALANPDELLLAKSSRDGPARIQVLIPGGVSDPSCGAAHRASRTFSLAGAVHVEAVMPPDTTLGEAQHALRVDLVRSLRARALILAESFEDSKQDAIPRTAMPIRVFDRHRSPLSFCDYALDPNSLLDCCENLETVLQLKLSPTDLHCPEKPCTNFPGVVADHVMPAPQSSNASVDRVAAHPAKANWLYFCLALFIVVMAVFLLK